MFVYQLSESIELKILETRHAGEFLRLVRKNYDRLLVWCPWLDRVTSIESTRLFLREKLQRFVDSNGFTAGIFDEETAAEFRPHTYVFSNIDIILVEGIFIFKRSFVQHFDLRIWIDCSFETALERAIARGQENLSPSATIAAYESIYFPAQRVHFEIDDPVRVADVLYPNE